MSLNISPKINLTGWPAVIAIIAVAFITSLVTYGLSSRDKDAIDYQTMMSRMDRSIDKLEKKVDELSVQNARQSRELAVLKAGFYDDPTIRWIKQKDGKYLYVNKTFIDVLLIPLGVDPDSIIGRTDAEIFAGPNLKYARIYRKDDLKVIQTGKRLDKYDHMVFQGDKVKFKTIKYPYYAPGSFRRTILGVAGVAIIVD